LKPETFLGKSEKSLGLQAAFNFICSSLPQRNRDTQFGKLPFSLHLSRCDSSTAQVQNLQAHKISWQTFLSRTADAEGPIDAHVRFISERAPRPSPGGSGAEHQTHAEKSSIQLAALERIMLFSQ
jgi:hypothetical protein